MSKSTILVVGAGYAGSVVARQAAMAGHLVEVWDQRLHIGGNAFDRYSEEGVLYHPYGPHLFHTNSDRIFGWLSQFTDWRPYEHRVLTRVSGQFVPFPINLTTLEMLYGRPFDEDAMRMFLMKSQIPIAAIRTSEDLLHSSIGPELTDLFYRGYTKKQWGLDLQDLKAGVAARIPLRFNRDDRYFEDKHQAMPVEGYHRLFERMLDHPNIHVDAGRSFCRGDEKAFDHLVYTGPVDAFYDFEFGRLPYRSLEFRHDFVPHSKTIFPVCTVNFPNDYAFTRITEIKHATGQKAFGSILTKEFPQSEGDPYYPIPNERNEELFQQYHSKTEMEARVTFVGRLAQYRYYNMDQVVGAALKAAERFE